jgi:hypothetical protein
VKGSYKARVLAEIGADPKAAMLLYGRSEHHCGHCGRLIINDESIERGIGPVCAGRMGW